MFKERVAVVTGSNKGIGFAIVKRLCDKFDGAVYLTSRDEKRGKEAVAQLQTYDTIHYHQLDVADKLSVIRFRDYIEEKHGGIDILFNNAGISGAFDNSYESKKAVIGINYRGVLTVEEYLFPLLRDNARVINISSDCGHLSNIRNMDWIKRLSKEDLTRDDIEDFVNWYLDSELDGTFDRNDIADNASVAAYRVSKVALCALTIIQQRELEPRGILVNSMHPGLVSTDMSLNIGFLTPDEAAETPIYLALEAPPSLKGQYLWYNKKVIDWYDYKNPLFFKTRSVSTQYLKNKLASMVKCLSPKIWIGVLALGLVVIISNVNEKLTKD